MARMKKSSRAINVDGVAYRWRARGTDWDIAVTIWPEVELGPAIETNFNYDASRSPIEMPDGSHGSIPNDDHVIITNRIVRRVIVHAKETHNYDPLNRGPALQLRWIESFIDMSDAIRRNGASDG